MNVHILRFDWDGIIICVFLEEITHISLYAY